MFARMPPRTKLSQPGRADSGRFLQTSQTEDERAAELRASIRAPRSVWIGQLASAVKPAEIMADTSVSQAVGSLCAKTITSLPSELRAAAIWRKAAAILLS